VGVWSEAAGSGGGGSAAVGGALGRPVGLGDFLLTPPPSSWCRRPNLAGGRCKAASSGRASGWIRRRRSAEAEAGGGACGGGLEGRMASVATPSPLPVAMVARWPRLAAMRRAVVAMRRAEAREGQPGRPSVLGCSPLLPPLLAEFLLRMAAWWPNLPAVARAVASAPVRWPSSWMAEAMELGRNRCVHVRWRRRNMCLTSEVEHGWRWWRAVERGWRPERPGGLGSFPSTRSPSPCSTSAALNHSGN
jgi:hypothetical protein